MTKQKVLFLVPWEVKKVNQDDLTKYPANLLVEGQGYWFFKHWKDNNLNMEVRGINEKSKFLVWQRKCLHFIFTPVLSVLKDIKKADLIFCFHSQLGLPVAFWMKLFKINKPLILFDVEGIGRKNKVWQRWVIKKIISKISLLFYFAQVQKEDYQRYFPEIVKRSQFLPFGLDLTRFSSDGKKEEDYIVSIGYLFRDWKTLVKAYNQLNTKTKLLIIGKEKFEPEEIGHEKTPSRVEFVGKTDLLTLNEIASKAKFVVLPLPERRHAFGQMTLLGCMALGKAVVCSRVSSITDYLTEEEDGLLANPYDPKDLALKMQNLLDFPDMTEKLGRKAKLKVQAKFAEPLMAEKIEETLKNRKSIGDLMSPFAAESFPTSENVLLLGFGYYPHRISGDKNFWLGLSKELCAKLDKMVVVSVNSSPVKYQREGKIHLYNIQRPFHRKMDCGEVLSCQLQRHPLPWEILERSATMLKLIPLLKKLVKLHDIGVIHLMDNFGFLTGLVKVLFPDLRVYATAITYNAHNLPLTPYSFYQKIVFGNMDKVVASSKAYREKLIEHGISREKIKVIRWGVPLANGNEGKPQEEDAPFSSKVILWTGYTQQIKTKSFYASLSLAQSIIRKNSSVDFIFAFKPECYDKKYGSFQQEHLQVITTNSEDFPKFLGRVRLLLAPVESFRSIVAPPLTWIECMALGIPIITTQARGVDEILTHNLTGFVAKSNQELEGLVENVLADENLLREVSTKAKEWVKGNYNLKDIAQDYLRLWREDGRAVVSRQNCLSV